jgi:hypothetical protein
MTTIDDETAQKIVDDAVRETGGLGDDDPVNNSDVLSTVGVDDTRIQELETRIIEAASRLNPPFELTLDDFKDIDASSTVVDVINVTKTARPAQHKKTTKKTKR